MRFPYLRAPIITVRDPLLAHPAVRWCAIIACALLAGAWIATIAVPNVPGDTVVVIHYTTTFGIDALGRWVDLLRFPATGTVLLALNLGIARLLAAPAPSTDTTHAHVTHVALILVGASVLLEFAVFLGSLLLWRVNT